MSYLLDLAGLRTVIDEGGEEVVATSVIEVSSGLAVSYNPSTKRLVLTTNLGTGGETATPGSGLTSDWAFYDPQLLAEDLVFGTSANADAGEGPGITILALHPGAAQYVWEILTTGALGEATFRWSDDNGSTWEEEDVVIPADGIYELPGTDGVTAIFGSGTHTDGDQYSHTTTGATTPNPGSGAIVSVRYRIVGDSLELDAVVVEGSGADWGSGAVSFQLPDGYEVDVDKCVDLAVVHSMPVPAPSVILRGGSTLAYAPVPMIVEGNRLYVVTDISSFFSFVHLNGTIPVVATP